MERDHKLRCEPWRLDCRNPYPGHQRQRGACQGQSSRSECECRNFQSPCIQTHTDNVSRGKPTDFKHIDMVSPPNSIVGCDFAGVVDQVGANAPGNWKVGDRIAGVVHGGLHTDRGSYAQYLKAEGDLAWKIPDSVTDQQAATYGISAVTAMQGLYLNLDVPWPDENARSTPKELLVYAGSTGASLFAIQLAKLAGYRVVTTCSPHSFDLVKQYGADAAYDYHDDDTLAKIKAEFPNISGAFDGISAGQSTKICSQAIAGGRGKVITLGPGMKSSVKGVEVVSILMYTLLGRPFQLFAPLGPKWLTVPEDRAALVRFYAMLPSLISRGLRSPPTKVVDGGFDGLRPGMDLLKAGKISGQKLIVNLS